MTFFFLAIQLFDGFLMDFDESTIWSNINRSQEQWDELGAQTHIIQHGLGAIYEDTRMPSGSPRLKHAAVTQRVSIMAFHIFNWLHAIEDTYKKQC